MKLFGKSKTRELSVAQQKTAERIAASILVAQRKTADFLNRKTAGMSPRSWLVLLTFFCVAFGGYCLALLVQLFN